MVAYGPSVGSMLASDTDRERAIDVLRAGFAEGRLTQSEFEDRVSRVRSARTYAQLAELTCDLPAGPWAASGTAMVPYSDSDRAAMAADPSFASLALTAVVVFTLAALVTALAVYAHLHGQAFVQHTSYPAPPGGGTHLLPFVKSQHAHHG
jgi:hypothetical protein